METVQILVHNKMFVAPLLGWFSAQIIKTIIHFFITKKFQAERLIGSGGMPSSHSATVVSLVYSTAYCCGISGFEFPAALVLAIIVMYDAMNVRMETGKQAVILNYLLKNEEIRKKLKEVSVDKWPEIILKEYVGHTPTQVLGGMLLGVLIGYLVCRFL